MACNQEEGSELVLSKDGRVQMLGRFGNEWVAFWSEGIWVFYALKCAFNHGSRFDRTDRVQVQTLMHPDASGPETLCIYILFV